MASITLRRLHRPEPSLRSGAVARRHAVSPDSSCVDPADRGIQMRPGNSRNEGDQPMPPWEAFDARAMGGLLLVVAAGHAVLALKGWFRREPQVAAHFSPKGGCMAAVVAESAAA